MAVQRRFSPDLKSIDQARRFVGDQLRSRLQDPDLRDVTDVVADVAAAAAIRGAGWRVSIAAKRAVRIEMIVEAAATTSAEGSPSIVDMGLASAAELSDGWDVELHPTSVKLWVEFDASGREIQAASGADSLEVQ